MRPPGCAAAWWPTVRDLFEAGIAPPADAEPPANGSPRFRAIVRRQVQSLDWLRVPLRFYDLQAAPPRPADAASLALARAASRRAIVAVRDEWPRIRADIDAGSRSDRRPRSASQAGRRAA